MQPLRFVNFVLAGKKKGVNMGSKNPNTKTAIAHTNFAFSNYAISILSTDSSRIFATRV